jgi:hypothetical protein
MTGHSHHCDITIVTTNHVVSRQTYRVWLSAKAEQDHCPVMMMDQKNILGPCL